MNPFDLYARTSENSASLAIHSDKSLPSLRVTKKVVSNILAYGLFGFSVSLTGTGKAIITASRHEFEILEAAMRAGTDMDMYISHVHADEAQKLQQSIQSVLRDSTVGRLEWSLSKRELLHVVGILGALQVLSIADYYPDLMDAIPPEETLDAFGEHVDRLYDDLRGQMSDASHKTGLFLGKVK